MQNDEQPDEATEPDGPVRPDGSDHGDIQAALFGTQAETPQRQPPPSTAYLEIERARRQRLIIRIAVAGALAVIGLAVAVLLLVDDSDDTPTEAQLVEVFECPGDPASIAMVPVDDLVVDGIDSTSSWLLVVEPLPELGVAWVRAADLDRSRTSLRVTTCGAAPEPTPVPTSPAEPTPTATPEPEPTPAPVPTLRDPSEVTVLVLNAARVEGLAGRVTDALADEGYQTRTPDNADQQSDSQVFYAEGFAAEGEIVALLLEIDPERAEPQTDATPDGADIVVVLGSG